MLIGCIAYGLSTSLFLAPNNIVAGGVTGLSVIINFLSENIPIGMISIAINLPVLALGIKFQGWKFIFRCLLTVITLGVVTDILSFLPMLTEDSLLASLYGGICQGVGIGLFIKYDFSSGGTELLGRIISRFVKSLKIPVCVAITLRESKSANDNDWSGMLYTDGQAYFSKKYSMHIVDRVGGGDSYGGGLIYSLVNGYEAQKAIEFAVAASCLKHTIEGDYNMVSVAEVQNLAGGDASGRVQR